MRVLGSDELAARAAAEGVAWGGDDDLAWREALRAHLAAEGSVLRRTLVERVLRWHGAADDDARERVHALLDDLDAVGDAYVGDRGLVGAAPLRAAVVRGSRTALLLGSVPTAVLAAALPGEAVQRRRVRRAVLTRHDGDDLARALAPIGGRVIDAGSWAGLDRAPPTLAAWREALAARAPGDEALEGEREVFIAGARSRWRRDADAPSPPRLERARQPGGWFRYAWRTADGDVALHADEAARTALALEAEAGAARVVLATAGAEGLVEFTVPGRLPRAEYRLVLASCDRLAAEAGATRYAATRDVWAALAGSLRERLGLRIEETGVTT